MQDPTTAAAFQAMMKQPPQFPEQEQLKCPRCDSTNTKFCYYNNYNLSQPRHFCKNCRRYWTKGGSLRNIPVGGGTRKNSSTTKRSNSSSKRPNPDQNSDAVQSRRRVPDPPLQQQGPAQPALDLASLTSAREIGSGPVSGQNPTHIDPESTRVFGLEVEQERKVLDMNTSFSSLLASSGQFGNIFDGLSASGSGLKMVQIGGFNDGLTSGVALGMSAHGSGWDVPGRSGDSKNHGGGTGNNGGEGGQSENYLQSTEWGGSNGWPNLAVYTPGPSFQ